MRRFTLLAATLACAQPGDITTSVFEPNVAIDPDSPDRIVAGAQHGAGYNRGGLRFRTWATSDGGGSWSRQEVALRALERPPTMAADLSLAFGLGGELFGFGISGDSLRHRVPEAALALAVSEDGGRTFAPRALLGETVDHADGAFSVSDKPWMAIDRGSESRFRGSLYFAWTRIRVRKLADGYHLERELVFSYSRDSGRSHSDPLSIAESGGGAQLAVRPDGIVDLVWVEEEENRSRRVLHAFSRDGGRNFSAAEAIEALDGSAESIDLPTLAANPKGELSACWARGPVSSAAGTAIRCSGYQPRSGWSPPSSVKASGYPALAATENAFWLLGYYAGETLRVALHCSRDGRSFEAVETLAETPLSAERFCPRSGLPCRKDLEAFTPGDYVGLAASSRRLAAAYVLPGSEAIVSVVELGGDPCSIAGSSSTIAASSSIRN
ncbi:MAG TPA: sialidase family protein [Vicinamibacteria bacterium]|nr:sialidase family protein [Vicinamibacteria bacterium]